MKYYKNFNITNSQQIFYIIYIYMATNNTGFTFYNNDTLVDFFNVFQPEDNDNDIRTGFKISDGTDIGNLFASGNSNIVTDYKDPSGIDLGSLFLPKLPFSASGASQKGVTDSTDQNYYYAIFNNNGTVVTNKNSGTLYSICVGGGGAGGWSTHGISPGGGGGGGVDQKETLLSDYSIDTTFNVTVGRGGIAARDTVDNGEESSFKQGNTFISRVSGGFGGTDTGWGSGGGYYHPANNNTVIKNGGDGGDRGNGYNSTSYSQPLDIPSALNDIIQTSYSGGGGGGKGNDMDPEYGGGGGKKGEGGLKSGAVGSYNGEAGISYGDGGGSAGVKHVLDWAYIGGNGGNGVVIVYSPL